MSVKPEIEAGGSTLDTIKLLFAVLLLLGGVVGFYWFASEPAIYRWLGLLGAAVVALLVAYTTVLGKNAWQFMQTSRLEVRKMVWPNRQETIQTTLAVVLVVVVLGLFMWGLDALLGWATRLLVGGQGV